MILTKTISISIKHETTYKDQTDIPQESYKEMTDKEIKENDEKTGQIVGAVVNEIKDIMKAGVLDGED
jgi:hypothetical protein